MQALQRNGIGMMRAIQVAEHGAANVLKLMTDIPKPSIQPGIEMNSACLINMHCRSCTCAE